MPAFALRLWNSRRFTISAIALGLLVVVAAVDVTPIGAALADGFGWATPAP
ncbi:hypothetical protein ACFQZ8_08640 [Micromonospora azadirachtae]|uniref:Uncharacterized protein n=1 Tax=Micromonospora azadirachtae TaxID=1970735 RepID=A0ABW2ZZC3_9ACTN